MQTEDSTADTITLSPSLFEKVRLVQEEPGVTDLNTAPGFYFGSQKR